MGFYFFYPNAMLAFLQEELEAAKASAPILDNLIYATIVLFILSVITEKLTQLIRFYPRQFRWIGIIMCGAFYIPILRAGFFEPKLSLFGVGFLLLFNTFLLIVLMVNDALFASSKLLFIPFLRKQFSAFNNISKSRSQTPGDRVDDKEKEITAMSFIVGFLIAYCFNANLFGFFKPAIELGWGDISPFSGNPWFALNPKYFDTGVFTIVGFMLTAFFLAFGSKFFHDLLDTLLQTKNLKRKLYDKHTYSADTIQEFDDYLALTESDIVNLAIAQHEQVLKSRFRNISFVKDSLSVINGKEEPVLAIYLYDDNTTGIPDKVPVRLPNGNTRFVLTEIIPEMDVGSPTVLDGGLAGHFSRSYVGSVCCVVNYNNDQKCLLSNCHVFTEGDLKNPLFEVDDVKVYYEGKAIGKWIYGSISPKGDFAIASIDDYDRFADDNEIETFSALRDVTHEKFASLPVTVRGNTSKIVSKAFIVDVVPDKVKIAYNYGQDISFNTAILIGNSPNRTTCRPVTDFGDSGGAVYDANQNLIGIITGRNRRYTIATPLHEFFKTLTLNL